MMKISTYYYYIIKDGRAHARRVRWAWILKHTEKPQLSIIDKITDQLESRRFGSAAAKIYINRNRFTLIVFKDYGRPSRRALKRAISKQRKK